jgi:hypothetical protein
VDAVEKRHILPDHIRHGYEEMRRPDHHLDRLVGVTEHGERRLSRKRVLPSGKHSRLAVRFQRRHDLLGHLLEVGYLIEGNGVPDADKPHLAGRHVVEEIGDRGRPSEEDDVGRKLLIGIALASTPRPEFDKVVVWLAQRKKPNQKQELEPPLKVSWLQTDTSHQKVDPLV